MHFRGDKIPSRDRTQNPVSQEINDELLELMGKDQKMQALTTKQAEHIIFCNYGKGASITKLFCNVKLLKADPSFIHYKINRLYSWNGGDNNQFYYYDATKYCMHRMDALSYPAKTVCDFMDHQNNTKYLKSRKLKYGYISCVYYFCFCQHFVICKQCIITIYANTNGFKSIFDILASTSMDIYLSNPYPLILIMRFLNILLNYKVMIKSIFKKKYLYRKLFEFWRKFSDFYLKFKNCKTMHFRQCFDDLFIVNVVHKGAINEIKFDKSILRIDCKQKCISDEFILHLMHELLINMIINSGEYWTKSVYRYLLNHKHFMNFLCNLPIYKEFKMYHDVYYKILSFILLENQLERKTNISLKYLCNDKIISRKIKKEKNKSNRICLIEHKQQIYKIKRKLLDGNYANIHGPPVWKMQMQCFSAKCKNRKYDGCSFYKCKGCKIVRYCSRKCQKIDWNQFGHRDLCDSLRQC